ncbi:serine protease Do [Thermodesulfobium acidiphilum]|uniref:Serine protease Do n=1 Tax=Thermodesulfobium acidiphilum TaxID=1794699 RepID=A0A2R4W1C1_THEAF|nr:trypsin-like peptidase domain-containing protein [Thermodesulfobium acidiphilum]AWB10613.1 serine protease Do [Thermodesulfobium acidiphilum]
MYEQKENKFKEILVKSIFFFVAACFGGMLVLGAIWAFPAFRPPVKVAPSTAVAAIDMSVDSPIVQAVKKVMPSVVQINTLMYVKNPISDFFGIPMKPIPEEGLGSGVIIKSDGLILTNNHVIANATKVKVTLSDGRKFDGEVIGADPVTDLAVVKVNATGLPAAELGSSSNLQLGEWAIAIGNPYGFSGTVTLGIVSALDRRVQTSAYSAGPFIQTDAAINPGNSGGPLVDINGRVIGINTAIIPYAQGIGFAIPIDTAKEILNQLITNHEVVHPYLGIDMLPVDQYQLSQMGIKQNAAVYVAKVLPGSPAEKAGILPGDIILKINDKEVDIYTLPNIILTHKVGDVVKVTLYRSGKIMVIPVTLEPRPANMKY